eukprot:m.277043 g.277043  ORF g.277043 m.277043 type:complete len:1235 (-) comp15717_c4_seq1:161-3865(-)
MTPIAWLVVRMLSYLQPPQPPQPSLPQPPVSPLSRLMKVGFLNDPNLLAEDWCMARFVRSYTHSSGAFGSRSGGETTRFLSRNTVTSTKLCIRFTVAGNSSWMVGVLPTSLEASTVGSYLKESSDERRVAVNCSTSGVQGPQSVSHGNMHRKEMVVTLEHPTESEEGIFCVKADGKTIAKKRVRARYLPATIGILGFGGTEVQLTAGTAELRSVAPDPEPSLVAQTPANLDPDSDSDSDSDSAEDSHVFRRTHGSVKCHRCGMFGPSPQTGRHECKRCRLCETCCSSISSCPKSKDAASDDDLTASDESDASDPSPFARFRRGLSDSEDSDTDSDSDSEDEDKKDPEKKFKFIQTTGSALLLDTPDEFKKLLEQMTHPDAEGGVIFIDEAYQLLPSKDRNGAHIVNLFMDAMEQHRHKLTIILAGYEDDIDTLMGFNDGLRGRFRHQFKFLDYHEGELYELFTMFVQRLSDGKIQVAAGHEQAQAILARRMGRARSQKHFDNARMVRRKAEEAITRCKQRLFISINAGLPFKQELTWEDILGVCPISQLKENYAPLLQLQNMVGFPGIKHQLLGVLMQVVRLMAAELSGERIEDAQLNQRLYGNPGTGKTTIAQIYGQVLCDLGVVSKNDIVTEYPSRLKGVAVGEAEENVRAMMEKAREKVLFIDEAYQLLDDSPHSAAMMEALVSEIAPVPSFRPIIIIAGYKDRMEKMLTSANPGLYRRLAPNPALVFEGGDFNEADLSHIVRLKIQQLDGGALRVPTHRRVIEHAVKILLLAKQRPNFGNGGAVENLVGNALSSMKCRNRTQLIEDDFGQLPSEDVSNAMLRPNSPLNQWFQSKRDQIRRCRVRGVVPILPSVFIFTGAAGAGKKSEARQLLHFMNAMQVMGGSSVQEVSVTSLVGQFVGQSTPKLLEKMHEQKGGLLVITNAGRLMDSSYGREVVRELYDQCTKAEFAGKVLIALIMGQPEMKAMFDFEPAARSLSQVLEYSCPTATECADVGVAYMHRRQLYVDEGSTHQWLTKAMQAIFESFAHNKSEAQFGGFRVVRDLIEQCDCDLGARWTLQGMLTVAQQFVLKDSDATLQETLQSFMEERVRMQDAAPQAAPVVKHKVEVKVQTNQDVQQQQAVNANSVETVVEQLALVLEEAVKDGIIKHEEAEEIAQHHDFDAEDPEEDLPGELVSFMRRKGLDADQMRKESKSMRKRMKEAREMGLEICPICFLPEDSAREIGCPWNFRC